MIITEFRLVQKLSTTDADRFIARIDLPETPGVGEVVNIDGDPYIVYEKGWAVGAGKDRAVYCYIRVTEINARQ